MSNQGKTGISKLKEQHLEKVASWSTANNEHIQKNREQLMHWNAEFERWKVERELAKLEKQQVGY